ncbi:SH3 domain-containing protein [Colidextribacter sp. OB.20]|uniref:SH3 domain-containing protein n=1 Tax=Colidextribacter sp. OB.20 TaxID=2304568 RepID=UPI00136E3291|nr:SH3 domain-containing protein [Colidextribacter sp. OB.20]
MKQKVLISGLSLLLTFSLAGCGGQQAQQEPQEPDQEKVQQTEPIMTSDNAPEQLSNDREQQEPSGDELIEYFQLVYNTCSVLDTSYTEEQIAIELDMLVSFCDTDGKKLPSDYEQQYRAWRPAETEQTLEDQTPEVTLTFTDCNETVWATGTVNLRSGPSTEDDKVGSLNKNQSVTRIGIGIGDYSSWSKVKLSDGSEVYVTSSYLTNTKSSTGNTQQGGGNTQNKSQGDSVQQGNNQQVGDSSLSGPDALWQDPYAGMTPEEKAAAIQEAQERTQKDIDATQGTMSD